MVVLMKECGLATIWRVWATKCIPGSTSRSLGSEYSDANRSAKNDSMVYYSIFMINIFAQLFTRMRANEHK